MPKMIQLRNVPDRLHRTLKTRAKRAGMTLSEYLIAEIQRSAERPSLPELLARLSRRTRARPGLAAAEAVRAERETR